KLLPLPMPPEMPMIGLPCRIRESHVDSLPPHAPPGRAWLPRGAVICLCPYHCKAVVCPLCLRALRELPLADFASLDNFDPVASRTLQQGAFFAHGKGLLTGVVHLRIHQLVLGVRQRLHFNHGRTVVIALDQPLLKNKTQVE